MPPAASRKAAKRIFKRFLRSKKLLASGGALFEKSAAKAFIRRRLSAARFHQAALERRAFSSGGA
jgi:hypothetical protein